jgi:HAD superfamily hydrolase (TIGR01509 family)
VTRYKAIAFDFFGVLCSDPLTEWFIRNGMQRFSVEFRRNVVVKADVGEFSFLDICAQLARVTTRDAQSVEEEILRLAVIDEHMMGLCQRLKSGYRIGLCSNAPSGLIQAIMPENRLATVFDCLTISSSIGKGKPGDEIFDHMLRSLGSIPKETIFIDDHQANVEASRKLGLEGILFSNQCRLETDLKKLGLMQ